MDQGPRRPRCRLGGLARPTVPGPLGTTISGAPVTVTAVARYVAEITALSVVMTWMFVETGGSLWIAVWLHASWNAATHRFWFEPFPDDVGRRVEGGAVLVLVAFAVVLALWPSLAWRG